MKRSSEIAEIGLQYDPILCRVPVTHDWLQATEEPCLSALHLMGPRQNSDVALWVDAFLKADAFPFGIQLPNAKAIREQYLRLALLFSLPITRSVANVFKFRGLVENADPRTDKFSLVVVRNKRMRLNEFYFYGDDSVISESEVESKPYTFFVDGVAPNDFVSSLRTLGRTSVSVPFYCAPSLIAWWGKYGGLLCRAHVTLGVNPSVLFSDVLNLVSLGMFFPRADVSIMIASRLLQDGAVVRMHANVEDVRGLSCGDVPEPLGVSRLLLRFGKFTPLLSQIEFEVFRIFNHYFSNLITKKEALMRLNLLIVMGDFEYTDDQISLILRLPLKNRVDTPELPVVPERGNVSGCAAASCVLKRKLHDLD